MRKRWIVYLAAAMLAGALGGTLLGPAPVGAVAREIVELQQSINQLIQGQKDMQTTLAQNAAVDKTLMEQSMDTVNKLTGTMMALQKTVQDMQAIIVPVSLLTVSMDCSISVLSTAAFCASVVCMSFCPWMS